MYFIDEEADESSIYNDESQQGNIDAHEASNFPTAANLSTAPATASGKRKYDDESDVSIDFISFKSAKYNSNQ